VSSTSLKIGLNVIYFNIKRSNMSKFKIQYPEKSDILPELSGQCYNFIRKFAGITWIQLASIENLKSRGINNRKNKPRVKPTEVFYLYKGIFAKFGDATFFWRGIEEYNRIYYRSLQQNH
jgi:hypothetical protein